MEQTIWLILTAGFAALSAGLAAALWRCRQLCRRWAGEPGREVHVEYETPDFTRLAGFRLDALPDSDVLTPTRYWLVDGGTAEVEYSVAYTDDVTLRAAPAGTLQLPGRYTDQEYEGTGLFTVGDVEVTLHQSAGRESLMTWTQDGFDFALFAPGPEMNLLGGISQEFVAVSSGSMQR